MGAEGRTKKAMEKAGMLRDAASTAMQRRAERNAVRNEKRAEHSNEKAKRLTVPCVYLGSSQPQPGLKPGRKYIAEINGIGLRIVEGFKAKVEIPWTTVASVEVIDASRMQIKSRVEQRATGGIWALPGTTAPVSRTSSKHNAQSKLALQTEDGDWLLQVQAEPGTLEGKILLARGMQ